MKEHQIILIARKQSIKLHHVKQDSKPRKANLANVGCLPMEGIFCMQHNHKFTIARRIPAEALVTPILEMKMDVEQEYEQKDTVMEL